MRIREGIEARYEASSETGGVDGMMAAYSLDAIDHVASLGLHLDLSEESPATFLQAAQ